MYLLHPTPRWRPGSPLVNGTQRLQGNRRFLLLRMSFGRAFASTDFCKRRTFVHCQVISFVALDQILGFFLRGVNSVPLEDDFGGDFLFDCSSDLACLRVPLNMIPNFEFVCHW